MDFNIILLKIKKEFEAAITTATFNGTQYSNWQKAKEALIRSQKIINYIHDYAKHELIINWIDNAFILPPLWKSKPEAKIQWFLKKKNQDITYIPKSVNLKARINVEECLTVNVRSQLSSMQKNIDTLYERTFAEALNLHLEYPNMCLGEVYMIPAYEYDDKKMTKNKVEFKAVSKIEKYLEMFYAIADRNTVKWDEYKYERVALIIVDFNRSKPKFYLSIEELIKDGLIDKETKFTNDMLSKISIKWFWKDIVAKYKKRFKN